MARRRVAVMSNFSPVSAAIGGAMIAASLAIMLIATGRIAGLSGMFAGLLRGSAGDWEWRAWFFAGMLGAGALFAALRPETFDTGARAPLWLVGIAGALV